jgi:uncharacterized membrane protein
MKFQCAVEIRKPLSLVIELFTNPNNLKEWQDGFISMNHLSGEPGEMGSKSRFFYKTGKRELELIETIIINNLPDEFTAEYWSKPMVNTMTNRFAELANGNTKYTAEIEYTKFNGLMPKLMALLFPRMFKKQVQKWINQFRDFAEK